MEGETSEDLLLRSLNVNHNMLLILDIGEKEKKEEIKKKQLEKAAEEENSSKNNLLQLESSFAHRFPESFVQPQLIFGLKMDDALDDFQRRSSEGITSNAAADSLTTKSTDASASSSNTTSSSPYTN